MKFKNEIEEILAYVSGGSCTSLWQAIHVIFKDKAYELLENDEFLNTLNDLLFECDNCGWLLPIDDLDDQNMCYDCYADYDQEEEND